MLGLRPLMMNMLHSLNWIETKLRSFCLVDSPLWLKGDISSYNCGFFCFALQLYVRLRKILPTVPYDVTSEVTSVSWITLFHYLQLSSNMALENNHCCVKHSSGVYEQNSIVNSCRFRSLAIIASNVMKGILWLNCVFIACFTVIYRSESSRTDVHYHAVRCHDRSWKVGQLYLWH